MQFFFWGRKRFTLKSSEIRTTVFQKLIATKSKYIKELPYLLVPYPNDLNVVLNAGMISYALSHCNIAIVMVE